MKRTRKEQEADIRSALDMLERAGNVNDATTGEGDGPVHPNFAIGWAIGALQRALDLSYRPLPSYVCNGPTERERIQMCGNNPADLR